MRITTQVIFRSHSLDTPRRRQAISSFQTRTAKRFKFLAYRKNVESPKTGRYYRKYGIRGASRWHRASARGEYPAQDTGNLLNSIKDRKLNDFNHAVYQDSNQAHYGRYLIRPRLGRTILPASLATEYSNTGHREEIIRLINSL